MDRSEVNNQERALLVGVIHGNIDDITTYEHIDELELLANTAGANVVGRITQKLNRLKSTISRW